MNSVPSEYVWRLVEWLDEALADDVPAALLFGNEDIEAEIRYVQSVIDNLSPPPVFGGERLPGF